MKKSSIKMDRNLKDFMRNPEKHVQKKMTGAEVEIECPGCKNKFIAIIGKKNQCPHCDAFTDFHF